MEIVLETEEVEGLKTTSSQTQKVPSNANSILKPVTVVTGKIKPSSDNEIEAPSRKAYF